MNEMHLRACTRRQLGAFLGLAAMGGLAGCTGASDSVAEEQTSDAEAAERVEVRVGLLNCPASLGLVPFAGKARAGETAHDYEFVYQRYYGEVETAMQEGELDIAVLQPTRAATLYNVMGGGVTVLDVAGLAEWTLVTRNKSVKRLGNLRGRTLYATAASGALGFTLRYLLELAGIRREVNVVYLSSNTQVVASLSEDPAAVGVTSGSSTSEAMLSDPRILRVAELSDIWDELTYDGSACIGYVAIARKEFVEAHPEVVADFVAEHKNSIEAFLIDPITYAPDAIDLGLSSSEEVCAADARGNQIGFFSGAEMRVRLEGQLQTYANRHIPFIGGALPGDDFYLMDDAEQAKYEKMVEELRRQAEERALEEAALAEASAG